MALNTCVARCQMHAWPERSHTVTAEQVFCPGQNAVGNIDTVWVTRYSGCSSAAGRTCAACWRKRFRTAGVDAARSSSSLWCSSRKVHSSGRGAGPVAESFRFSSMPSRLQLHLQRLPMAAKPEKKYAVWFGACFSRLLLGSPAAGGHQQRLDGAAVSPRMARMAEIISTR